ncbi:MAG: hypothetical protein AAF447_21580, partial [Myxococcota bacterium]
PNPGTHGTLPNAGRVQAPRRDARPGRLSAAALRPEAPAARRALRADVGQLRRTAPRPPHRDPTEHTSPNERVDGSRAQEALRWLGAALAASHGRAELRRERDAQTTTYRLRQPLAPRSADDALAFRAACLAGERAALHSVFIADREAAEVAVSLPSDGDAANPGRPSGAWLAP